MFSPLGVALTLAIRFCLVASQLTFVALVRAGYSPDKADIWPGDTRPDIYNYETPELGGKK